MPLLVNSVPNLAQGVSQQPDNLRYPGQCDEQINAWATVVEGLVKRPHTSYIKNVDSSQPSNLFTHFVKRDETNKYVINVSVGGSVSAVNLSLGTSISVYTTSIAQSYLSGITNPVQELRALTVADYTFLVNKSKTVAVNTDEDLKTKDLEHEALVFVKLGDYEKTYDIYLDGKVVPYGGAGLASNKTPPAGHTYESGSASSSGTHADTEIIAEDLETVLKAGVASLLGVTSLTLSGGSSYRDSGAVVGDKAGSYYKYTYRLIQKNSGGTIIGDGCQGELTFSGGSISSQTKTHNGSGYDTDTTTNPLTIRITQHVTTVAERVGFKKYGAGAGVRRKYTYYDTTSRTVVSEGIEGTGGLPSVDAITIASTTYDIERQGAVIKITADNDFSIRTEDGLANQGLGVAYKEVDSITDLPKRCFNNFRIRIRGDADIAQDDYYVRFQTKDKEDYGEGSWVECAGWENDETSASDSTGIDTTLDFGTMPVTVVPAFGQVSLGQNPDVIYSFRVEIPNEQAEGDNGQGYGYTARQAGDDFTNPFPSFVGQTINDVFFFKNRLGFLTNNAVIFSEADAYFNFFRTTTQQLLDSAPIDVGLSHTKVAVLQHAIPFQEKLMLFSKQSQFVLRGADILSPKTVAISPVTEYDISDSINPLAVGNYIYFTFQRNDYEGVYEYFVDNNTETFNAEEITQQIPKYINKKATRIVGSPAENTLVITTDDDLKTLFVYKYFWSNKEKIQSAWMKFTFDRDIVGCDFIDSKLFMLTSDTEGLHLESLTLEDGLKDSGLDYTLYLDSRVEGSEVNVSLYNPTTKKTRISDIPYSVSLGSGVNLFTKIGTQRAITTVDSTTIDVNGTLASYVSLGGTIYKCETTHTAPSSFVAVDTSVTPNVTYWSVSTDVATAPAWSSGKFYNNDEYFFIGRPYNMLYRFSDQTLKQPTERGGRSASDYTYQTIRSGSLNYADTGHFTVEVTPKYRDTYSYAFNPDIVGANLSLNEFTPQNGHFRFAVQAQPNEVTIEVKSSSALPVKILAAEFESMFIPRSRRYGS